MRNIVVLGGSFNPPTIAHEKIMKYAMKVVNAELGLFVPSSEKYVVRKMKKQNKFNQVYSEYERDLMIRMMCDSMENCEVDTVEFGDDGRGRTYETLCKIRDKHKDSEIYFICGADKLHILPKWRSIEDLLENFNILVMTRAEDEDPHELIKNNRVLSKYFNKFIITGHPDGIENISSTEARKLIGRKSKQLYNICDKLVAEHLLSSK